MSMNAQAYDHYKKATVETVAPEQLLVMLYEGAIRFINNAEQAIEAKDANLAHQQIIKAEDIVVELMSTLKMEYEISQGLFDLYGYLYQQLVQANVKKDIALLEEVKGFLVELLATWLEAIKSLKTPATSLVKPTVSLASMPIQAGVNQEKKMSYGKAPQRSGLNIQG